MNDFFTELDSDLGTKKIATIPVQPRENIPKVPYEVPRIPSPLPREQPIPNKVNAPQKPNDNAPSNHIIDMRSQMMGA